VELSIISEKLEDIRNYLDVELHPVVSPDRWDVYSELRDMVDDIIALLKAQEPRVMTLEEIDNRLAESSEEYNKIFWAEVKSRTRYSFGVFQLSILDDDDYEALLLGCSWSALYRRSSYGIRWRCWTSRPTDEQRKEARWDE